MISQRPDHPSTAAINSSEAHPFAINDQFELPPTKRQKVTSSTLARKASQVSTSSAADLAPRMVMSETSPTYSKGHDVPVANDGAKSQPGNGPQNPSSSPFAAASVLTKPKRVRTGCLTCRNRHLKCDEAMPICVNCQKSNRKCERGIRLNFIDLKVEHLYTLPPVDWKGKPIHVSQPQLPTELCCLLVLSAMYPAMEFRLAKWSSYEADLTQYSPFQR